MKVKRSQYVTFFWMILSIPMFLFNGCQQEKPLVPDPGVVSWTFRNQLSEDVPGTLDIIKEMGITNMEFSGLFGETPQSLKDLLDERGMICTSYGVSYDALVNETQKVAEDALTLGADYVRIAWIPHDGEFTIDHAKKTVEDFNRAGKILHENGLFFCYHNHGYEFSPYENGTLFDYIVENTEPEWVSFEMDILWVQHPGADPVALLEKYPERFRLMHLKDLKKGVEGDFSGSTPKENDVVLGTGQIDIPAVLHAAQKTNIEYYYIEDESADVITRVPQSLEYIKTIK